MISVEVRSLNGRPSASTPVTFSGTACTMRVLRRLRKSELALTAPSFIISAGSSAACGDSSGPSFSLCMISWDPVQLAYLRASGLFRWLADLTFREALSGHKRPDFFRHPNRSDHQIHRALEKRRIVSLNAMPQK